MVRKLYLGEEERVIFYSCNLVRHVLALVFMLIQDSYQIFCVLNLLTTDSAGSEFVGNTEIIA